MPSRRHVQGKGSTGARSFPPQVSKAQTLTAIDGLGNADERAAAVGFAITFFNIPTFENLHSHFSELSIQRFIAILV